MTAAAIGIAPGPGWWAPDLDNSIGRRFAVRDVTEHGRDLDAQIAASLPVHSVERCRALVLEAINTPASRKVAAAAVTLLVGSRARRPEDPQMFMRALEFDLVDLGFSPTVVVVALQRLRREAKFMPEIPEVIAACEAERSRLRAVLELVERAARYRIALEAARAQLPHLLERAKALQEDLGS